VSWVGSPNYDKGRGGNTVNRIVIHWMAGTLAATDSVFQDTTRQTSAHYGIEDNTVHQYVLEGDTAFHAGNYTVNQRTIGIEHSAQPGRDASEATYHTSARLIANICQRYGLPINANTIIPHRAVVATQCPGTVDLGKLIQLAQQISDGESMYEGKTAEQWAKAATDATNVAEARRRLLSRLEQAAGVDTGKIDPDQGVDQAIANIAAKNEQIAAEAVVLKPGKYIVR
jgi:N-acetyl-anhydromuramyl-L-alanine amidase AmpD